MTQPHQPSDVRAALRDSIVASAALASPSDRRRYVANAVTRYRRVAKAQWGRMAYTKLDDFCRKLFGDVMAQLSRIAPNDPPPPAQPVPTKRDVRAAVALALADAQRQADAQVDGDAEPLVLADVVEVVARDATSVEAAP
ncbi:MAG TPA: hypothetical protein VJ890_14010 [Vineibacter sp.]|nr:hypothetical protein [Vineibacter sp.]